MIQKNKREWYNEPSTIINCIIVLIISIMLFSQRFAINNNLSVVDIFGNIINHNINYTLILIYFVLLKTNIGKKYFNYLNIFIIFLYFIFTITSCLSVFYTVTLTSILTLGIKLILFIYLVHTMFRDTNFWKEFGLEKSPFNELNNDWYFYAEVLLSVVLLAVNMILVTSYDAAVLTVFDCLFVILFARYIYLYRDYLDYKKVRELRRKKETIDKNDDKVSNKSKDDKDNNDVSIKLEDKKLESNETKDKKDKSIKKENKEESDN